MLGLIVILDNLASMNILTWTPTYAKEQFEGVTDADTGFLMSMMAAGVLSGRVLLAFFITGKFSDRRLLGVCYALSMVMFMGMLLVPSFWMLVVGWFMMSFFMSVQAATTYAIGSEKFKGKAGVAIPIADGIGTIGALIGPPLLGWYADLTGGKIGPALWIVPLFGFALAAVAIGWEVYEKKSVAAQAVLTDDGEP